MEATRRWSTDERAGLSLFWMTYDGLYDRIAGELIAFVRRSMPIVAADLTPERLKEQGSHSRQLAREAVTQEKWDAYAQHLHKQCAAYAEKGVKLSEWYPLVAALRQTITPYIVSQYSGNEHRLVQALLGLGAYIDFGLLHIGEAYMERLEKETR